MKDQLAIYPNRLTMVMGVLFSALFAAAAATMLLLFGEESPLFLIVIFWVVLLLFGFLTISSGVRTMRSYAHPQPQLLLNAKGITFFDGDGSPHPIAWAEITGFKEIELSRQTFMFIEVRNPQAVIEAERSPRYRKLMEHHQRLYGAPLMIPPTLKYPRKELLPTLRSFHDRYRSHE